MRIVVDTNVIISGVFFGGAPGEVLKAIVSNKVIACASKEIIEEYIEIVNEMIERKQGKLNSNVFLLLVDSLEVIESKSQIKISRDPDDDKFIFT